MNTPAPGLRSAIGRLRGRLSFLASPAWYRAPILLLRYPGLLAAVLGSVLVLSVASAAGPLFLSSAGNATLRDSIEAACPWDVGLHVTAPVRFIGEGAFSGSPVGLTGISRSMDADVHAGIGNLLPMERFGIGSSTSVTRIGSAEGASAPMRPAFRDGFEAFITPVARGDGEGIWLAQSTAQKLGVVPGDRVLIRSSQDGRARIPVAGIYRDLASQPRSDDWCLQEHFIYPLSAFENYIPPPFGLVDADTFSDLERRLKETGAQVTFEFQPRPGLTLPEARVVASQMRVGPIAPGTFSTQRDARLPFLTEQADATVESLRGPVETIAIAGRVVALLVIAAAGVFWVGRRRSEVRLLSARGTAAAGMLAKVVLEALAPAAVGAVAGALLARWVVGGLGPSGTIDAPSAQAADRAVLWSCIAAVVLVGVSAALPARRVLEAGVARRAEGLRRYPWELVVLALAGAALYEILTRGSAAVERAGEPARVDRFLLLFPILFVAGGAGLAVRGLRRVLPALRAMGSSRRPSLYLASRRLAGASGAALTLVIGASVAIGVLSYSATLNASVQATSRAKAAVFVGSDVDVTLVGTVKRAPRIEAPFTVVRRIERASVDRESGVDVIGIDPMTFARAAFWDKGFAPVPLERVLGLLSGPVGPGRVPIVVTGEEIPRRGLLRLPASGSSPTPVEVVLRTSSFPGMRAGSSLLVMDRSTLLSATEIGQDHLWLKGQPSQTLPEVARSGQPVMRTVSVDDVGRTAEFLSLSYTFDFLQALGIMAGAIALAGGVLQMEARQREREISYALSRRMGLSRRSHRVSVVFELGAILLLAVGLGMLLAWLAAILVLGQLDPLPKIPPQPLFRAPGPVLAATVLAALLAAWAGAVWVQRTADRARVAEVMRVAG